MVRTPLRLLPALLLVLFAPSLARAADSLAARIEAVIDGPDYKQAHWGILVVDAQTGKTVYAHNPDRLVTPASTTKLFSCAAALATFGADHRFETPVYQRGEVKDGVLMGDLILVASGDLTLGGRNTKEGKFAFKDNDHIYANSGLMNAQLPDTNPLLGLEELARQVAKSGIREVGGEILVDDRMFAHSRGSGSGPDLLTPVVVNDNVIDIVVRPGKKPGDRAEVKMHPETAFIQMDADVTTAEPGKEPLLVIQAVAPRQFSVRGRVAADSPPKLRIYPVEEPALFARALFIEALRRHGVRVQANLYRPVLVNAPPVDGYKEFRRVAVFRSAPLSELIKVTLKVSHNLYASTLPLLVGVKHGDRTLNAGLRRQAKVLTELGVDVGTISFAGGAGGAYADAITPRSAVQVLQGMAKRPENEAFLAGLPVLGVDGTLSDAVPADSPARGKVRAKTGTLVWYDALNDRPLLRSKALAGVLETANGTKLYVAMFVNDVPLPQGVTPTREGKVLGKLCEIIYRNGP